MRPSIVASILLHGALIALAARMPAPPEPRASRPIEVEVNPPEAAPPKPAEPPAPSPTLAPQPELAMRTLPTERDREREREREHAHEPTPTPPPEVTPPPATPPQVAPPPEHTGPIDLRLHALPGSSGDGIVLPPGSGPNGTIGAPAGPPPRRAWHPRGDAGDPILGKIKDEPEDDFPLEQVGHDEYVYKGKQFSAHIMPDGSVSFDDKIIRDFNGTSGSFDITDAIMKSKHQDPYRAEKERFLAATAKKRDELKRKARAERLEASLAGLPDHLEEVWEIPRPASARRKILYQIWRDTDFSSDDQGQAGARARAIIEQFIRRRLPEGSPDAYTPDELAAYGQGAHPFHPY